MADIEHRRHVCSHCWKRFGKAEHLRRHERIHSGSKPYQCALCKYSSARQDALARHQKRHDASELNGEGAQSDIQRSLPDLDTPTILQHTDHNPVLDDSTGTEFQLNWPDSEDLLQSILSADLDAWPAIYGPDLPDLNHDSREEALESPWVQSSTGQDSSHTGNEAVLNLSRLITSVSTNVTAEAKSTGLTTTFLDDSLLMFWNKFVPTFPVVHEPTFIFKDWTYPLLLNAIALGSLFTGREEDKIKGEILWRLAHTSVATSWHSLIKHKGPYDACSGIQLVLTALLGQTYAILSKNASVRTTAAIFHSLGFFWAQEAGMYDFRDHQNPPISESDDSLQSSLEQWRTWAARETQLRALLGHYIMDGYISQYTGGPTCRKHTTSTLHMPISHDIFTSPTCERWSMKMKMDRPSHRPLWKIFSFTFSPHTAVKHLGTFNSAFGASVILEGIKSLVADAHAGPVTVIGNPSRTEITYALSRFHVQMNTSGQLSAVDGMQLGLRWHAIIIDIATDFNQFCHNLCHKYDVRQTVFRGRREDHGFDLDTWACSSAGRRSLLSAIAIHDILSDLPMGIAPSTHLAAAIFMAAIVYCGILLSGVRAVSVPQHLDHENNVMLHDDSGDLIDAVIEDGYSCFLRGAEAPKGVTKNLRYDINLFLMSLQNISEVWAVATEMQSTLHQLLSEIQVRDL